MKKLMLSLIVIAFIGMGSFPLVTAKTSIEPGIQCEHCKADHKCDDKCKKGKKSKCCKKDKAKSKKCCASKSASKTKKCSKSNTAKKATCTKGTASNVKEKSGEAEK